MKQEVFDRAQQIQNKLIDIEAALTKVDEGYTGSGTCPMGINFHYLQDREDFLKAVVSHLKLKRSRLLKEFANLK